MTWQPIEVYDALAVKPKRCVFFFEASPNEKRPYASLAATVENNRNYGLRVCTHWLRLPDDPQ